MWASQLFFDPLTILHWGQAHERVPPTITMTGWSLTFSVLIFFAGKGVGVLAYGGTSIAGGGSISVVTPSGDEGAVADLPPLLP